ncbi:MAG: hypothetical protein NC548_51475 [Lachnospiraceae bacterium]|nr:hypothetical protein [Lachnospiraceae bacterium]
MEQLTIPGTNVVLYPGSIVVLAEYPYSKWIVKQGWYTYNNQQLNGWYFKSINDGAILSLSNVNLDTITIVSQGERPCPPPHNHGPMHGPFPGPMPGPMPGPVPGATAGQGGLNARQADQLRRSFITVDTIKQRDALDDGNLPDGKICRVNNVNGKVKYYSYDVSTSSWVEQPLDYLTTTEADQEYVRQDDFNWEFMTDDGGCTCDPSCSCRK